MSTPVSTWCYYSWALEQNVVKVYWAMKGLVRSVANLKYININDFTLTWAWSFEASRNVLTVSEALQSAVFPAMEW